MYVLALLTSTPFGLAAVSRDLHLMPGKTAGRWLSVGRLSLAQLDSSRA